MTAASWIPEKTISLRIIETTSPRSSGVEAPGFASALFTASIRAGSGRTDRARCMPPDASRPPWLPNAPSLHPARPEPWTASYEETQGRSRRVRSPKFFEARATQTDVRLAWNRSFSWQKHDYPPTPWGRLWTWSRGWSIIRTLACIRILSPPWRTRTMLEDVDPGRAHFGVHLNDAASDDTATAIDWRVRARSR